MGDRTTLNGEPSPPSRSLTLATPAGADQARELERLTRYARTLDASIGIPGTSWRIGLDPILGLIPGVGDWIGVGLSAWILHRARRLGVSRITMGRMLVNLALEATLGAVPVLGDLFDAWFRANQRNVNLIVQDLQSRAPEDAAVRPSTPGPP